MIKWCVISDKSPRAKKTPGVSKVKKLSAHRVNYTLSLTWHTACHDNVCKIFGLNLHPLALQNRNRWFYTHSHDMWIIVHYHAIWVALLLVAWEFWRSRISCVKFDTSSTSLTRHLEASCYSGRGTVCEISWLHESRHSLPRRLKSGRGYPVQNLMD